ncbi:MAG: AraC family transcriptional regulator [Caldilineaceae bacterium]
MISELIQSVGMKTAHLAQGTFPHPWGIDFPQGIGAAFHLVTRGSCWLRSPQLAAPIQLTAGDLAFVSHQISYVLLSDLSTPARPLQEAVDRLQATLPRATDPFDETRHATSFICGIYGFAVPPIHPFFTELPPLIHLRAQQIAAHEPMYAAQRLLSAELSYAPTEPGKSLLTDRLVDVMLYYILRQWMSSHAHQDASWINAYSNPELRNALLAIHADPAHPWQVEELAQKAGLSRAAFAQRFKDLLGDTPLNYVTKVRMQKAMAYLVRSEETIEQISERVGYATGFALSKAFKRITGVSPQQYRLQATG